jgi:hypothetical protein
MPVVGTAKVYVVVSVVGDSVAIVPASSVVSYVPSLSQSTYTVMYPVYTVVYLVIARFSVFPAGMVTPWVA